MKRLLRVLLDCEEIPCPLPPLGAAHPSSTTRPSHPSDPPVIPALSSLAASNHPPLARPRHSPSPSSSRRRGGEGNGDGLHLRTGRRRGGARAGKGQGPRARRGARPRPLQGRRPPPPPRPRQSEPARGTCRRRAAAVRGVLVACGPRAARDGAAVHPAQEGGLLVLPLPLHRLLSRHQPGPLDRGHARRALEPADLYSCHLKVVDVGSGTSFTAFTSLGIVKHVNPKNVTLV